MSESHRWFRFISSDSLFPRHPGVAGYKSLSEPEERGPMTKHRQDRAHLLRSVGRQENNNRSPRMIINSINYVPVPPPLNLQTHPADDCMVWLGKINKDGYGIGTFLGGEQLAHRQAFKQSGRTIEENSQVLYLCHRPYCVQPSHHTQGIAATTPVTGAYKSGTTPTLNFVKTNGLSLTARPNIAGPLRQLFNHL